MSVQASHRFNDLTADPVATATSPTAASSLLAGNVFLATVNPQTLMTIGTGVGSAVMGSTGIVAQAPFVAASTALIPVVAPGDNAMTGKRRTPLPRSSTRKRKPGPKPAPPRPKGEVERLAVRRRAAMQYRLAGASYLVIAEKLTRNGRRRTPTSTV